MHFLKFAERVIMLVRGGSLASTMSHYLIEQIDKTPNIEVWTHTSVIEVHGDTHLSDITIQRAVTTEVEKLPASSLFIFIGAQPRTEWLDGLIKRDERGFILSGPDLLKDGKKPEGWTLDRDPGLLETNVPGVFVVGDVRHGSVKRVASGVGEGAGVVPFSRMKIVPLTARAVRPVRVLAMNSKHFPEMLHRMPDLAQRLVGVLTDRVRSFTMVNQEREKLAALGKLSAGLAHELNNPSSAARRSAGALRGCLARLRQVGRSSTHGPDGCAQLA